MLVNYCVFDVSDTLLIMRPYQIAATERILWKIKSSYQAKNWSNKESGWLHFGTLQAQAKRSQALKPHALQQN